MVFRRQPENGHAIDAACTRFLRKFNGCQSLENTEQRASEKPDLLAGQDGGGSGTETFNVVESLVGGVPILVLALEDRRHMITASAIITLVRCFVLEPFGESRRARIEVASGGSISEEVSEKPRRVRNLSEGQTVRLHRQFS